MENGHPEIKKWKPRLFRGPFIIETSFKEGGGGDYYYQVNITQYILIRFDCSIFDKSYSLYSLTNHINLYVSF